MSSTPVNKLFDRLRVLLPKKQVDELWREYKRDEAAYNKASRQRTRARQAAQRMARDGGKQTEDNDDG